MSSVVATLARRFLAASTLDEVRHETLDALRPIVGFDFAIVWRPGDAAATFEGFDRRYWNLYQEREAHYAGDIGALVGGALRADGVIHDAAVLNVQQRSRSALLAEITRPLGAGSFLTAVLRLRGQVVAMMQLGRTPGFAFTDKAAQALRELLPVITLAEAARPALTLALETTQLTPREREVLTYLTRGFTNREIGLACGTSPNTVRNQLVSLFRKANVSTRVELVAWALGALA
jgi:DNA-binding CsgD family transcriptional regulator